MRKFDSGRLYKLTKMIVITISILALLLAVYCFFQLGDVNRIYSEELKKCFSQTGDSYLICMGAWGDYQSNFYIMTFKLFGIGIGLPIIFFGGRAVYKYVFPVREKTKKEE
jgi:hypothetical protein